MQKRKRKFFSVKNELLNKSLESMLTSVQVYNNPNIQFKAESFVVLAIIAWTYLLHAYYREQKVDYRYFKDSGRRKTYDRTKNGAYKYWELERCLNTDISPIDDTTAANLRFLIGLRHEIEHQMTSKIDDFLSARLQACCLNYNTYLKKLFGEKYGIEKYLTVSLQFSAISEEQAQLLSTIEDLPKNIARYVKEFDEQLSEEDFNDQKFSYRVLVFQKTSNSKGGADRVIEFVDPSSEVAQSLNKEYWAIKDREKPKFLPSGICKKMQDLGFVKFKQHQHTRLWQTERAKDPNKNYGVQVEKTWYWYESWAQFVEQHCKENSHMYQ